MEVPRFRPMPRRSTRVSWVILRLARYFSDGLPGRWVDYGYYIHFSWLFTQHMCLILDHFSSIFLPHYLRISVIVAIVGLILEPSA